MKKTISVEQKHIEHGQPGNNHKCPIALAGSEQLGNTCVVERFEMKLADGDGKWFSGYLPGNAVTFVDHYDSGVEGVAPFTFEIDFNVHHP